MHRRINLGRASSGISSFQWHQSARLVYLTGGTVRRPRMITYTAARYQQSVRATAEVLLCHGVGPFHRVAVCHPFDPWAIGGVFRDAALLCGAGVLPLGLNVLAESLWASLLRHDPTVICGSASVLLRLGNRLSAHGPLRSRPRLIFHAGEPLPASLRQECAEMWRAKVINVYGNAEFDTLACEGIIREGLILSPHLQYALFNSARRKPSSLVAGQTGELLIRSTVLARWFRTKDSVRVLRSSARDDGLWPGSLVIEHLGRLDNSIQLPDGTVVHANSIHALQRRLPIVALQVHSYRRTKHPRLRILVIPSNGTQLRPQIVRRALLQECFELSDAVRHDVVGLSVKIAKLHEVARTDRGKVRIFVEH
jgi:phenylacetate-coenzyme A ligase PaaK-like adenylate-forming protein